jgi:hypothetical protein
MKVKVDFVTNSSSTSFVVMGASIYLDKIPDEYMDTIAKEHNLDKETMMEDPYETIENFLRGSDLSYSFGSSYDDKDSVMVGICYTQMQDDETLANFKRRIKLQILEKFGVATQVGHIEECWMDN